MLVCLTAIAFMRDFIDVGVVGLIIAYVLPLSGNLENSVTSYTSLENKMVSVERCKQFTNILSENFGNEKNLQLVSKLDRGKIQFKNVTMRYRPQTPIVLDNINFVIEPSQKIGIAGRTGSGKSSLTQALFRIVEIESGQILIDDINVQHINLSTLRENLCIIPQDPVLFMGTLRFNIDPFLQYESDKIIQTLKEIQLYKKFENEDILEKKIEEKGTNLSVGERQLVCIARAILKNSKILILDEATASIDFKTDEIIQFLIKQKFQDRTVLTIAHRINTIEKSDKILVLDQGKVVNFDTFQNLQKNVNSIFKDIQFDH